MSNAIFPLPRSSGSLPGISWNITRAPQFATKVQKAVGGAVTTYAFQPYPIYRWTLEYEFLRSYTPAGGSPFTEWQTLEEFFKARQGAYDSFLFTDPDDTTAAATLFGTGDGTTTAFQLGRALTVGGFFEPVYNVYGAAYAGSPQIYKNAVLQASPADYSLSASGLVTFTSPPALGLALTWTGTYRWRTRFADDLATFELFANGFWRNRQVALVSVLGS
jgi:uncharacterized protein (TIGR02217 family)